jgi:hypothetical protein
MGESDSTRPRNRTTDGAQGSASPSVMTPPLGLPRTGAPEIPAQREAEILQSNPISGPITPVPPRAPEVAMCTCGHAAEAHEHYRAGADCGACGEQVCGQYTPVDGPDARPGLLRRLFGR